MSRVNFNINLLKNIYYNNKVNFLNQFVTKGIL